MDPEFKYVGYKSSTIQYNYFKHYMFMHLNKILEADSYTI